MESTFLFEGLNLKVDKKDTPSYKLEALKIHLEKIFGQKRLVELYWYFENVKDIDKFPSLSENEEKNIGLLY